MNGTLHQQALSAVYWMNYRQAQRLAIVGDRSPRVEGARRKTSSRLLDEAPKLVSLQTLPAGQPDMKTVAKAALASHPDFVYWTGSAASGGALAKALRALGYRGTFTASAASESQAFLDAAGPGGAEGAFVTATPSPQNTPTAAKWRAQFKATLRPRARARRAPGLRRGAHARAGDAARRASTDGAKVAASIPTAQPEVHNFLGVVRFAPDHTLLYDNRVILVVKDDAFAWERSLRTDSLQ